MIGAGGGVLGLSSNYTLALSYLNTTPRDFCGFSVALLSRNLSMCGATSGYISLLCKSTLNGTAVNATLNITNASAVCAKVPSSFQGVCTDSFLYYQAAKEKNSSICMQISEPQYQYGCLTNIAIAYKDNGYCAIISNATAQGACDFDVAHAANSSA